MVTESEVEVYKAENGDVIWNVHKSIDIKPEWFLRHETKEQK